MVAAFRVSAVESDDGAEPTSRSKAGVLVFQPVEFLVGPDWLITCWHDHEIYRGADRIRESPPSAPADLFREVNRCWATDHLTSAGDMAVLVLQELAHSYNLAYRELYVWQQEWELDFYRRPERIDRDTLLEAPASAAVMYDWLAPLNPAGMRRDINRAWFPGITGSTESGGYARALQIDDRVDGSLRGLREFAESLRASYDLMQIREGELERERDDRFQRTIAVGGAAILIPTLVAGVMGANTWVPGEYGPNSTRWAFVALIAFMAISALAGWLLLHRMHRLDDRDV